MDQPSSNPLQGARVLIVEDEYFIADDLIRAISAAGADPVGPVASVEQADALLAKSSVDAVVVDLNLRGSMAFDFVERLAGGHLPCLIVSGYGETALPESLKAVPRLEKPVRLQAVVDALSRVLRETA
jgi:DNA-binding NtrC family response regulator